MSMFAITNDNNTAFAAAEQLPEGHLQFANQKEFANRIWRAIQPLIPTPAQQAAPAAPKKAKSR